MGLLCLEETGGISKPYKGYIGANLVISGFYLCNEDMLFFEVLDHKHGKQVPVQLGTLVIDLLVVTMITEELQQAGDLWKQAHLSTVLSKRNPAETPNIPKYDLKGVKGKNRTLQKVVILPFVTINAKGAAALMTHSKCMNVIVKPNVSYLDHVTMDSSYGVLGPGVGKTDACL